MKKILNGIAVVGLFLVIAFFGLKDVIIKNIIEKEMTKALETKVQVYGVDYSVFKNFLELKKITIEDVATIEKIDTQFNFSKILSKNIQVKEIDVKNLEFIKDKTKIALKVARLTNDKAREKVKKYSESTEEKIKSSNNDWKVEVEKINLGVTIFNQEIVLKFDNQRTKKIDLMKFIDYIKKNIVD